MKKAIMADESRSVSEIYSPSYEEVTVLVDGAGEGSMCHDEALMLLRQIKTDLESGNAECSQADFENLVRRFEKVSDAVI